jgi:F-type H+-transporting ATPase subunit a
MLKNQSLKSFWSLSKTLVFSFLMLFSTLKSAVASTENGIPSLDRVNEKRGENHQIVSSEQKEISNIGLESHAEKSHNGESYNPGKMIFDHISDAHDWHLWGEGESSVSIPLPVILYTASKGLQCFSSSKFHHGHASHDGFQLTEEGKVAWTDDAIKETIFDFSLSKNVIAMFIGSAFLLILVLGMAKHYRENAGKAPKGIYNLIEPLILTLRDDIARPTIGKRAEQFLPLLLSIFFFIFCLNLFGLIPFFPGGANVTGNISVTMILALVVFVTVTLSGNKYYWKHIFMPDVPVWMYVIIIPIEILGVLLKPFVLMLRLFANITAGHIIILGFFSLIFIFGNMSTGLGYAVSPLSVAFTVFMSLLELLVAFLQAFVFTLLTSVYIGMAVEEHHH